MLKFDGLDQRVRKLMVDEIELDVRLGRLYLSPRLSDRGRRDYEGLLREAAAGCTKHRTPAIPRAACHRGRACARNG